MFSEAYLYLKDALNLAKSNNPNFNTLRDLASAAQSEILRDRSVTPQLKQLANQYVERIISYTYSRTNPMPFAPQTFESMTSTPISPFQSTQRGPYGFVREAIIPSQPKLVPFQWTGAGREAQILQQMINAAINVVRRGL